MEGLIIISIRDANGTPFFLARKIHDRVISFPFTSRRPKKFCNDDDDIEKPKGVGRKEWNPIGNKKTSQTRARRRIASEGFFDIRTRAPRIPSHFTKPTQTRT
jgi:hypothetical protein